MTTENPYRVCAICRLGNVNLVDESTGPVYSVDDRASPARPTTRHPSHPLDARQQETQSPSPRYSFFCKAHSLNCYRFIGRILCSALYEGILVDVAFTGFFLTKVRLSCSVASSFLRLYYFFCSG